MSRRPNILVLIADQLRPDVLGAYGGRPDVSPQLDRLARESAVFQRHLTACPLCVPARISMATGLMPHQHGAIVNAWDVGEEPYGTCRNRPTFYEALAASGYRVEHFGTDHLRCDPPIAGRHERIRFSATTAEHQQMLRQRGRGGQQIDLSICKSPCIDYEAGRPVVRDYTNANTTPWPGPAEEFFDAWLVDRVLERFDGKHSADAEPDALLVNFWLPHCPLAVPPPYYEMFDPDQLALPASVGRWYPGQSPMQLVNLPGHVAASTTPAGWRKAWAVYLGMVRFLDDCIARLLGGLEAIGWLDGATVVFTADHGEMLGSHRMFQKMCMYEEAIRVPMMVRGPGIAPGRRSQLTSHLDVGATICDLASVPSAALNLGGRSMAPMLADPSAPGRDEVFIEFNGNSGRSYQQRAIVTPGEKYIYNHGYEPEYYDTSADPQETTNLCFDRPMPPRARKLADRLRRWMIDTDDCIEMS